MDNTILASFRVTGEAIFQILLLGWAGYFLVKKNFLGHEGLDTLSRLVIEVTLPLLIFCQLLSNFRFSLFPDWWVYPLVSVAITLAGLAVGIALSVFINGREHKQQFISLVAFQNSGFLPLALIGYLLAPEKAGTMLIYLFLFLLGFNALVFSVGIQILSWHQERKFYWREIFSPPVIALLFSLLFVFFGLRKFIPLMVERPLRLLGDCTLPLSMLVVGGSLAQIQLGRIDKKAIFFLAVGKLIILPLLGLWVAIAFRLPQLLGLLIVIQLAVPSANSLTLIVRRYRKEDLLISQGIFYSHLLSIATIPLFLSLYFMLSVLK